MTQVPEITVPDEQQTDFGTITLRVVVLPDKANDDKGSAKEAIADLEPDEVLPEEGSAPVASYLERLRGGRLCTVFLVNGQRQEALDNGFVVQDLGFKYLRKRTMVIVDVDGLRPEALGQLIQGSRQGFYKGEVWSALRARVIATLKNDPELQKLEEEAESHVAELEAGDQQVKNALDTLIDAHHEYADHVAEGSGGEPGDVGDDALAGSKMVTGPVVELLSPTTGKQAGYPVLMSATGSPLRLIPGEKRVVRVAALPPGAWQELESLACTFDDNVDGLKVIETRRDDDADYELHFHPASDLDDDEYPIRTVMRLNARFKNAVELRQISIALTIKPVIARPAPILKVDPTYVKVTSRQPAKFWIGKGDIHVRMVWDGTDDLALGSPPLWAFGGRCLTSGRESIKTTFSLPQQGRLSMVIAPPNDLKIGEQLQFMVIASGPASKRLVAVFDAVGDERPAPPGLKPRMVGGVIPAGAARRPPYDLKFVYEKDWDVTTCWDGPWRKDDAAAYLEPTEKRPLTLLINQDMGALQHLKKHFADKKYVENEIKMRMQKYTSHVAFHLYQMSEANKAKQDVPAGDNGNGETKPAKPEEQRAEINRVGMTLIKLMEVAR